MERSYDIFISHAWRYHNDWNLLVDTLDNIAGLRWRNFSLPWYDPALRVSSEQGSRLIMQAYRTQVLPANVVFILSEIFDSERSMRWLNLALEVAEQHQIPTVLMPCHESGVTPAELVSRCTHVGAWDAETLQRLITGGAQGADVTQSST